MSREAIHYQQHLQETISTSCCVEQQKLEKHEQRCSEVKRKKWAKWAILTAPTPHPSLHPCEGPSLISEEKWSLRSLLSFKGDIWRMGGWTDPFDENLQGRLQTGAVHCPGLPWKPLYMLNLLLCPDLTTLQSTCWSGRKETPGGETCSACVTAASLPLSAVTWPPPKKKKKMSFFFSFPMQSRVCKAACLSCIGVKPVLLSTEAELRYIPFVVCLKPFQVSSVLPAASWVNKVKNQYLCWERGTRKKDPGTNRQQPLIRAVSAIYWPHCFKKSAPLTFSASNGGWRGGERRWRGRFRTQVW